MDTRSLRLPGAASGRWVAILAGLVLVAPVVAIAVRQPDREPSTCGPTAVAGAQPSRDGAVVAAARYATLLAELFALSPDDARRVVGDVASEASRPALSAAVDVELTPLQRQAAKLPGTTVFRQSVLATRVGSYTASHARVTVWVLQVMAQAGQPANPVASFSLVTVDMLWERQGWRLDRPEERDGPAPLLSGRPASADELEASLRGFDEWRPR